MALQCETGFYHDRVAFCRDWVCCMVISSLSRHDLLCRNNSTSMGGWGLLRQGLANWCCDTALASRQGWACGWCRDWLTPSARYGARKVRDRERSVHVTMHDNARSVHATDLQQCTMLYTVWVTIHGHCS